MSLNFDNSGISDEGACALAEKLPVAISSPVGKRYVLDFGMCDIDKERFFFHVPYTLQLLLRDEAFCYFWII